MKWRMVDKVVVFLLSAGLLAAVVMFLGVMLLAV
jgi:hypothetical protein